MPYIAGQVLRHVRQLYEVVSLGEGASASLNFPSLRRYDAAAFAASLTSARAAVSRMVAAIVSHVSAERRCMARRLASGVL